jgi:hypothetical protein
MLRFFAAVALLFAALTLMTCCVLFFEAPAYRAGGVSSSRPRAVVVLLPTAVVGTREPPQHWGAPPLWSLFMPVTYRPPAPVHAYDVPVPAVHDLAPQAVAVAGDAHTRLLGDGNRGGDAVVEVHDGGGQ